MNEQPPIQINGVDCLPPEEIVGAIRQQFRASETIHWLRQPLPSSFARRYRGCKWIGWFGFLISLAVLVMTYSFASSLVWLFRVSSVAGMIAGFLLILAPALARWKASRTVYVLTNDRALIFLIQNNSVVLRQSSDLKTLQNIQCFLLPDGNYGDIIMNLKWSESGDGHKANGMFLRSILDAERVKALAENLAADARNKNPDDLIPQQIKSSIK